MRTKLLIIPFLLLTGMVWGQVKGALIEKDVDVQKIVNEVVDVLNQVETKDDLRPTNVTIALETTVSKEGNAGVKVLVFKLGGSKQKTQSNKTVYNFSFEELSYNSLRSPLSEQLKRTINGAYEQLANIKNEQLATKGFSIELSFVLEKSLKGDLEYALIPITLSAGGSLKKKAVHSVKIDFIKCKQNN